MKKKIVISNLIIFLLTYIGPLYILRLNQENYSQIFLVQNLVFFVLLFGALLLVFLNYRSYKYGLEPKWLWTVFIILGITGVIYSGAILLLLFNFRKGIGL